MKTKQYSFIIAFMSTIKKILTLTIVLVLLIGSVAVSSLNAESVALNLYWYQLSLPLGFMLLLFASLGLLFGLLLSWMLWTWPANRKRVYWEREYFKLKQAQDEQQKQVEQLTQANDKSVVKIP